MDKATLFNNVKDRGLFYSYNRDITLNEVGNEVFIEHILKYADFDEIVSLFKLYDKDLVYSVWKKVLMHDERFIKLNLFLARLFFDMDVEKSFFNGEISERRKKLQLLASADEEPLT